MLDIKVFNILLLSILLQSFSFLTVKFSTLFDNYISLIFLVATFFIIMARAITWQIVLRHNAISKVYPFNSLVQVLIFLYAIFLFNENITIGNIVGLCLMVIGVILLGKTSD